MNMVHLIAIAALVGACAGGPILANPPADRGTPVVPSPRPVVPADPLPIVFPRDDGPHHRLTEWWYYTGHLATGDGRRFGFEYVIFRAERGAFPVSWASHLALTDEHGGRFLYGQRAEIGPQVDRSPAGSDGVPAGFELAVSGLDPSRPGSPAGSPWDMAGSDGNDRLAAALSPAEAAEQGQPMSFGLDLALVAAQPAVLHDRVGYIDLGPAGGSYYYSRPRMTAEGSIQLDGTSFRVTGEAWFDHQWGDFIAVGGGGWDWFAVNLADGTALTLSLVRDAAGAEALAYGTLVHPDGTFEHLDRSALAVTVGSRWVSPTTGIEYPASWHIQVPGAGLDIALEPTMAGQELDTRATTGVVYWEGSQRVTATLDGIPIKGEAYVELTGYTRPVAIR